MSHSESADTQPEEAKYAPNPGAPVLQDLNTGPEY